MPELTFRLPLPVSPDELWAWHLRPGAFERLTPPWDPMTVIEWDGVYDGARQVFEMRAAGMAQTWVASIDRFDADARMFRDTQLKGPFAEWRHTHTVEADGDGAVLVDHLVYRVPGGVVGNALGGGWAKRNIERAWQWRHHRMRWDFERQAALAERVPLTVAVSGATGFVGSRLVSFLRSGGHRVLRLVRRDASGDDDVLWKPSAGEIDAEALEGLDAVVHLAGAPISEPWTPESMDRIRSSRVEGTGLLARTLAALSKPPEVFVSASAVGIYGYEDGDAAKDETAPAGGGFAASVCEEWEAAAEPARAAGLRVVHPRIGVVMAPGGGALKQMLPPFRLGAGGTVGSGRQYFPWIALDDVVAALVLCIRDDSLEGPVNCTAPEAVPQRVFARALGRALGRPALIPAPAFAIRAALGQMGEELVLGGQRAVPAKLQQAGFSWEAPELDAGLRELLGT